MQGPAAVIRGGICPHASSPSGKEFRVGAVPAGAQSIGDGPTATVAAESQDFIVANHFLEISSANVNPGVPSIASGQAMASAFGRALNTAIGIQRQLFQQRPCLLK